MGDATLRVLEMLSEGAITVDEAGQLLAALDGGRGAGTLPTPARPDEPGRDRMGGPPSPAGGNSAGAGARPRTIEER